MRRRLAAFLRRIADWLVPLPRYVLPATSQRVVIEVGCNASEAVIEIEHCTALVKELQRRASAARKTIRETLAAVRAAKRQPAKRTTKGKR